MFATYYAKPSSYLIVLDNVAPPGATIGPVKGQLIRNEHDLVEIFQRAGLTVYRKTPQVELHRNYYPVMAWTLV